MSDKQDGGPAFPRVIQDRYDAETGYRQLNGGMSLRDWFAGTATSDDIAEYTPATLGALDEFEKTHQHKWSREWAKYQYADAMLKARDK